MEEEGAGAGSEQAGTDCIEEELEGEEEPHPHWVELVEGACHYCIEWCNQLQS